MHAALLDDTTPAAAFLLNDHFLRFRAVIRLHHYVSDFDFTRLAIGRSVHGRVLPGAVGYRLVDRRERAVRLLGRVDHRWQRTRRARRRDRLALFYQVNDRLSLAAKIATGSERVLDAIIVVDLKLRSVRTACVNDNDLQRDTLDSELTSRLDSEMLHDMHATTATSSFC